jgi:hypothetical protein
MFMKVTQTAGRRYAQLVESYRNEEGNPRQRTICTLGRLDFGALDFARLGKILSTSWPNTTFIPDIWQSHKNGGEGLWFAFKKLERLL